MAALTTSQERRLHELRCDYAHRLPERILRLMANVEDALFAADGPPSPERVELLLHQAHRLCGSAAIFGFVGVSAAARRLEDLLAETGDGGADDGRRRLAIIRQLEVLKSVLRAGAATAEEAAPPAPLPDAGPHAEAKLRVLLVDDDPDTRELLALHLRGAGLEVELADSGRAALELARRALPDVVVADVVMDGMSGYELCRVLREMGHEELSIILCSVKGQPRERVAGLRAGADDYVVKPFEPDELLFKVRRWGMLRHERGQAAPPVTGGPAPARRILVVDDDLAAAAALKPHLAAKGYQVECLGGGNEALDAINERPPDLVILDVMMPVVSGLDVCRWIRGNPDTRGLPVIFLTSRNRPMDVTAGKDAGSDLYLFKPVSPRRLVNMVEMFLSKDQPLGRRTAASAPRA
ncbi:MAG: response regulator [Vicinamibacteria bacterium]